MKILFVTATPLEYSSSANMRNIALIKGLISNDHQVYTLSYYPEQDSAYYNLKLIEGINFKKRYFIPLSKLHTSFTTKNEGKKSIKRKVKSLVYKIYTAFKIYDSRKDIVKRIGNIELDEKFDLLISSSDPKSSHLLAKKILEKSPDLAKRWIQYWGDPFLMDINCKSKMPKTIIKETEKRLLKSCDKVIYVSPFTLKEQKKIYSELSYKLFFLPIPYMKEKNYIATKNKIVEIGYFGDYYSNDRNILPLYNAIKNLKMNLTICGNSNIELEKTNNVEIYSRQPIERVEKIEKITDILICICNRRGTQIPGKIYHYAATNKPILIILDGDKKEELRIYFESFNRYKLCENTEEDIMKAVKDIINEKVEYKPLTLLSSEKIAKKFIE